MLDAVFEIIMDIVLDGTMEATGSKKVPMPVRVILSSMILIVMLGLVALMLWIGVSRRSILLILIAIAMLIGFAYLSFVKVRQLKRKS